MRMQTNQWFQNDVLSRSSITGSAITVTHVLSLATKGVTALVFALPIVVLAIWASSQPSLEQYLQATTWASGFVFLALAVDSGKRAIGLQLATGLTLLFLALLSSRVADEFAIVASVLVAAWVAASILRR